METKKERLRIAIPAVLTAVLIAADQLTKAWIVSSIRENTIGRRLMGDFLWIVHTRNLGIAFSIGDSASKLFRITLFVIVPAVFLIVAIIYYFRSDRLSLLQRFAIATIVAGGAGNLFDRIFRPGGVVDFVSFSMYGILGMERFPTFNVADLSITTGAILLLASSLFEKEPEPEAGGVSGRNEGSDRDASGGHDGNRGEES